MLSKINMIQERILNDISSGKLQEDDKLLSRNQYMERYTCARATVDNAITGVELTSSTKVVGSFKCSNTKL